MRHGEPGMNEFRDKVAVITGAASGIGEAAARAIADAGASVAALDRDTAGLERVVSELDGAGAKALAFTLDLADTKSIPAGVAEVLAAFGRIDILVNCAARPGGQSTVPTLDGVTTEEFNDHMNVKVMGYLRGAQAVAPLMKAQGWGRIINISGMAARNAGSTIGSVRNVSVVALTKNLANLLGPDGINVTVVHPGATRTERTAGIITNRAASEGVSEAEIEAQMNSGNSIKHLVDSREIAYVVTFLASPRSIAINGDVIAAGGGMGTAIHY